MYRPMHTAHRHHASTPLRRVTRGGGWPGLAIAVIAMVAPLASAPTARSATPVSVTIGDSIQPASITVPPGTVVLFRNTDDERHRMRPHTGPADFDTGNLEPGEAASVVMNAEGTYRYFDHRKGSRHTPGSGGTIVVTSVPTAPSPPGIAPPAAASVSLAGSAFAPRTVTIAVGGTVTWTNDDDRPHTVTAPDAGFDSGIMARGGTFQRTFAAAGVYAYLCDLHSGMTGTVVVAATAATAATATPPSAATPPPATPPPATSPSATPAAASAAVSIANNLFAPATVRIAAGGTVTWTNADARLHTVTAGDDSWDSGIVAKFGGTWQRAFATPGTYAYICSLHPEMTGAVTVVDAAGNAPPATTPPPAATTPPVAAVPATTPPSGGSSAALPTLVQVAMAGNRFAPPTIAVAIGGTVRWSNNDTRPHTVTAAGNGFDSGILARGATYERTFPTAGTYPYVCAIHPEMTGNVIVAANPAAAASSRPAASPVTTRKAPRKATTKTSASRRPTTTSATASVSMRGSAFAPGTVTVRPGGRVTWVNDDSVMHNVTAVAGGFDSGVVAVGARYGHTYATAGTYGYKCSFHPGMEGTVIVAATAGSASSAATASTPAAGASTAPTAAASSTSAAGSANGRGAVKASVEMRDNLFAPAAITVPTGSTVTFTNTGRLPHTATAVDASFDSKIVLPGGTWSTTFTRVGTFKYDCVIHPGMTGSVTVTEADTPQAMAAVAGGGQAGGPPASASGGQSISNAGEGSYRGIALLVSGLVIAGGALFLVGMLIVEDPRWRRAAVWTVRACAATWRRTIARLAHPIHPRPVALRVRLHH